MKRYLALRLGAVVLAAPLFLSSPSTAASCAPDFNQDGHVDSTDRSILQVHFGPVDGPSRFDLNGNGFVCGADLAILRDHWGPCLGCRADLDASGTVDLADRQELESLYGRQCHSDLGRSGDVGQHDLRILELAMSGTVEEPHPDLDPNADLNGDGRYDEFDEEILMDDMGLDCRADLNGDGEIDTNDLWALLDSMGPCPTPTDPPWPGPDVDGSPPEICDPKG